MVELIAKSSDLVVPHIYDRKASMQATERDFHREVEEVARQVGKDPVALPSVRTELNLQAQIYAVCLELLLPRCTVRRAVKAVKHLSTSLRYVDGKHPKFILGIQRTSYSQPILIVTPREYARAVPYFC